MAAHGVYDAAPAEENDDELGGPAASSHTVDVTGALPPPSPTAVRVAHALAPLQAAVKGALAPLRSHTKEFGHLSHSPLAAAHSHTVDVTGADLDAVARQRAHLKFFLHAQVRVALVVSATRAEQVSFCRDSFFPTGDLGNRGIRGAEG